MIIQDDTVAKPLFEAGEDEHGDPFIRGIANGRIVFEISWRHGAFSATKSDLETWAKATHKQMLSDKRRKMYGFPRTSGITRGHRPR